MFFIGECGINHNGDMAIVKALIDMAKECGADVVKFQKRNPEHCVPMNQRLQPKETPWGTMTYLEYKERMELNKDNYDWIDRYCKEIGIQWTASVWDLDSVHFMLNYDIPFIKVPSACLTDCSILRAINDSGVPVVISIGMSTLSEVELALSLLDKVHVTVLHCNSSYPAKEDELDLNVIPTLANKFKNATIGYSGHEEGIMPTIVAASMGASVIERHITLDKNMWGTDQKASLDREELGELISALRKIKTWQGSYQLKCYNSEKEVSKKLRR